MVDTTEDGTILPDKADEIVTFLETKAPKKPKAAGSGDAYIDALKTAYDKSVEAEEEQESDKKKKKKGKKRKKSDDGEEKKSSDNEKEAEEESPTKKCKTEGSEFAISDREIELYAKLSKMKADELKDYLVREHLASGFVFVCASLPPNLTSPLL